ncbi:MAG: DMT family transporter [Alphaproteobacteria bacterium]
MNLGIIFGFLGYMFFSLMDGVVKSVGTGINVFEVAFFITLFSSIPLFFARPKHERWRDIFKATHPKIIIFRALMSTLGGLFAFYSFTRLPMAEVYALIFLMPMIVTLLSVFILKEPVGWRRTTLIITGFLGVLLVIKPGFQTLTLTHLAAGLISVTGAIATICLRKIVQDERRVSLLGMTILFVLSVNFGLMMITGFEVPSLDMLVRLAIAGLLAGCGGLMIIKASSLAQANKIAPTQYSQMGWAVLIGIFFYNEIPDFYTYVGLVIIAISGFLTLLREETRFGWWSRMTIILKTRI